MAQRQSPSHRRKKSKASERRRQPTERGKPTERRKPTEEELQGPPPREALAAPTDQERRQADQLARYTETGPELTGGDVDADWQRAQSVGEEAVGGSVATPDQSVVDDLGKALGVSQAPDAEFRTSSEILEGRDRYRWEEDAT